MDIVTAAKKVSDFESDSLKTVLASIEQGLQSVELIDSQQIYSVYNVDRDTLKAALTLKKQAAQINVIIHAVGLLT